MRISDWSSDVCSSDLNLRHHRPAGRRVEDRHGHRDEGRRQQEVVRGPRDAADAEGSRLLPPRRPAAVRAAPTGREEGGLTRAPGRAEARAEEHTSELQSLMRISYAVF